MTHKLPEWSISKTLHLMLDLYDRDPAAPHTILATELNPFGMFDDDFGRVSLNDQLKMLRSGSDKTRDEIKRKTLIDIQKTSVRHLLMEQYSKTPDKIPALYKDPDHTPQFGFDEVYELEARQAKENGVSYGEYKAAEVKEKLTEKKIESELLRFFADQIEKITDAVERFDDTAFDQLIPDHLVAPFRELHINAILGNYGTACILCGAVLERTLQDLLPTKSTLNEAITEAKKEGLLADHSRRSADSIRDVRNSVVHGRVSFASISSDQAWETVNMTRMLVSNLYRGRLD